jgi:hypothetical protein
MLEQERLERFGRDAQRFDRLHGSNGRESLVRDEESHLAEEVSGSQSVEASSYLDLRLTLKHNEHPIGHVRPLEDRLVRLERHLVGEPEDGVEV